MPTTKAVIQIPEEDLVPGERGREPDRRGSSPVGPEGTAQSTIGSHAAALSAGNGEGTTQIEAPRQRGGRRSNRILKARNGRPTAENGNAEKAQPSAPARLSLAGQASHPSSTEVELKLLVEPEQLGRLNDAPVIAAYARNKGTVRLLKDTYYDTPAGVLRGAGVTLRVRQCGKRFVQTMKLAPAEGDLALRRGEWETPVAGIAPDFRAVTPPANLDVAQRNRRSRLRLRSPQIGRAYRAGLRDRDRAQERRPCGPLRPRPAVGGAGGGPPNHTHQGRTRPGARPRDGACGLLAVQTAARGRGLAR